VGKVCRSVDLVLPFGGRIRITATKARELLKSKKADPVSQKPFVIKLRDSERKDFQELVEWSRESEHFVMSGALMRPSAAKLYERERRSMSEPN
jgi:hypothetical protein